MVLFRIADFKHAEDLSGTGAKLFGGRWNSVGVPVHYMSSSRALAALEVLVNRSTLFAVKKLCQIIYEVPEGSMQTIGVSDLPQGWSAYPAMPELKKIGDDFIEQGEFLLLKVPSAVIFDEFNFLMNVEHPLAQKINILDIKSFSFDQRLM
ncbi:RES domain protein [compost metagenome]